MPLSSYSTWIAAAPLLRKLGIAFFAVVCNLNSLIHLLKAPGPRRVMTNGRMNADQLATARQILVELRQRITGAAGTDQQFAFALRRYVFKNLSYDERDTPARRTKLKLQKLSDQCGVCAYANCPAPHLKMTKEQEPELDRLDAIKGYTPENTVLMHHGCHRLSQKEKRFA
jgi:hypothetical protein